MEFTIQIPAGKDCFHKSGSRCYFHEFTDSVTLTHEAFCNLFGEYVFKHKCQPCANKQKINIVYTEE